MNEAGEQPSVSPRLLRALAGLGLCSIVAALALRKLGDFDLPWHLAYGRLVVQAKGLVRVDDLAYTHRPIQYAEFVSDVFLYGVMRWFGAAGLQLLGGVLAAGIALLLLWRVRAAGPVAWLLVGLSLATMNSWFLVRPATLSFLCLALFMACIDAHRQKPGTKRGRWALLSLGLLTLLWVNVHGFSVLGPPIAFAYFAQRAAARLARGRWSSLLPEPDAQDVPQAGLAALLVLLASGANLAGYRLLSAPFVAQRDFSSIAEWTKPSLGFLYQNEPLTLVFGGVVLAALALGRDAESGKRVPALFDLVLCALALILAHSAVRLIPIAVVLVLPFVVRRLSVFVPSTPLSELSGRAALTLCALYLLLVPGISLGTGFEPSHFPEAACRYLERAKPAGHMLNFMPYGGYLSWRLYPEQRVLIDGRSGWVHDPELTRRVLAAEREPAVFRGLVQEFDIEWTITRAMEGEGFGVGSAGAPDFSMVYWDDTTAIYARRNGPNRRLAEQGYRLLRHLTPLPQLLSLAASGQSAEDIDHDARLAVEQDAASPRAAFIEGCAAIALRDQARLSRAVDTLDQLAPGHPAKRLLRATWRTLPP